MGISKSNWWMWLRSKLLLLNRTRLTAILVVEQLLDLFTTWWLVFYMRVGEEINPLLQVVNGENGQAWLIGLKLATAAFAGVICWLSLSPKHVKHTFWWAWNGLAYAYAALLVWNTSLIVYANYCLP